MIHNITGAVNTDHVFSATECIQWYCEAFARQSCGQFYILVIICIWPSGFRTAPRVALKIPKPWNAQSLSYQAKPLRMCLSVSLCVNPLCHHHPSTTKKKCVFSCTLDDDVYEHSCARINQCFCVCCSPLADRWKPQAQRWGSLYWSTLPPARFPLPSCSPPSFSPRPFALTKQKEKLQSHTGRPQNLAAGSGSLRLLLRRDKSSPAFDTITQTERGRKHRCNIHIKITWLAAMWHGTMALRNMLAFCMSTQRYFVSGAVSVLILLECDIHKVHVAAL